MHRFAKFFKSPLLWIFLLALVLRIYQLGDFPYGFHVDEAKVAWNSLSILKTGRDDKNSLFSLYYNSFGDYRPNGIFYITVPSIALFGNTEFATRFPVALFGALTIFPIYFLIKILNRYQNLRFKALDTGHIGAFLLAISPWGIELSRATNEVVISTFFAVCSLLFLIQLVKSRNYRFGILSIVCIILSYFFYHAIRFLAPPLFVLTALYYIKEIKDRQIIIWSSICIFVTLSLTLFFSTTKEGLARFDQVSIFKDADTTYQIQRIKDEDAGKNKLTIIFDNKPVIYFKAFIDQYSEYFSGDFLVGDSARPYRFSTPGVGLLTYVEMILLTMGIIVIARRKLSILPLLFLLIAPIPASITREDTPNLSRAFLMLPFLVIIESYGFYEMLLLAKKNQIKILAIVCLLLSLNFLYFWHMYFNHSITHVPYIKNYSVDSPTYRGVGAKELATKLDNLSLKYDRIVITNFPDSIYTWYAFFTNQDPAIFNKTYNSLTNERDYKKIIFSEDKCPSDNLVKYYKQNTLYVDSWECPILSQIKDGAPIKVVGNITRLDGEVVYNLLERDLTKELTVNGVQYK